MVYQSTKAQLRDSLENWEKGIYIWGKFSANFDARNSTQHHKKFNKIHNTAQISTKWSLHMAMSLMKTTSKFEVCARNGFRVRDIQNWIRGFARHQILTNVGAFSGLWNYSIKSLTGCQRHNFSSRTLKTNTSLDHYVS